MDWTGLRGWHFILSIGIEPLPSARITKRRKDEKRKGVERRTEREPEILM